jgi:hypothetical protein
MTGPPSEVTRMHTRLLKCTLEVEASRAYWAHAASNGKTTARRVFEEYWFGARSLGRIEVLLANLRARYDAYPCGFDRRTAVLAIQCSRPIFPIVSGAS